MTLAPVMGAGKYAKALARVNMSKDSAYAQGGKRKGEPGNAASKPASRHAVLALQMRTSPLHLSDEELANFHRPRAHMLTWPNAPPPAIKMSLKNAANPTVTLTLRTLTGLVAKKSGVPVAQVTAKQLWAEWSKKMLKLPVDELPRLRLNTPRGMVLPMKEGTTLLQAGIKSNATLWATYTKASPPPPPDNHRNHMQLEGVFTLGGIFLEK